MRRFIIFLLYLFLIGFISASVEVHNYSVQTSYSPNDVVRGNINLTIVGEEYNKEIVSNNYGDKITLGNFLLSNGVNFDCSPFDCSSDYDYVKESVSKNMDLTSGEKSIGFVLTGGEILVKNLTFNMESNFGESSIVPLTIDFFGKTEWEFDKFSNSFMEKDWGCYNSNFGTEGALIGESLYCEMISIPNSGSLKVGAITGGSDSKNLTMIVYPESGTGSSWECKFNPNSEEGCVLPLDNGEIFYEGNYQVCVGAGSLTGYKIYDENVDDNCGFVYGSSSDSNKDYAVFAQAVKYASANSFDWNNFDWGNVVGYANFLIQEKYSGDCSSGCVLPVTFSGVPQNIEVSNVLLTYTNDLEWSSSNKLYDLNIIPAVVSFSGVLNLIFLGFVVDEFGKFIVSLGNNILFSETFEALSAPLISSVFPLDPPFGVPIDFYARTNFDDNVSLQYEWNFGDNATLKTYVPKALHTYSSGNYTLSLKVIADGNLTSEKSFKITTISPEFAIAANFMFKKEALLDVRDFISSLPDWYKEKMLKILNLDVLDSDLIRLEKAWNDSTNDESLKIVVGEIFALDVPVLVTINSVSSPYLMTDLSDINVEAVAIASGASGALGSGNYANSILIWQNGNVDASYVEKEFLVVQSNGESDKVLKVYDFDVLSKSDRESYFVINKPFNELFFKTDVGVKKAGDVSAVILQAGEKKKLEFYYEGSEPTSFFVSPELSSLVLEADIDTSCNYDEVCDKVKGENAYNCRSDCKPIVRAWIFFVLGILFLLIVYSGLVIWYKRKYESYLFKDSSQVYNLLMYVANARARGVNDLRIGAELRSKGWTSERVSYIIKKSRGQRTGMFEIIPIDFISAFLRDRAAAKKEKMRVATLTEQQEKGNINKSGFQEA
ncbi:MAG: PKD domain-containing protein [archaeon]